MKHRWKFDYQTVMAIICFAIFTFCMLKYFEPVEAISYEVSGNVSIPAIGLTSDGTKIKMEKGRLNTPATIVGSFKRYDNKTLLIGHSSTAFSGLENARIGQEIEYNGHIYNIYSIELAARDAVDMDQLLVNEDVDTLVLMTCAGKSYGNGDASHRLIIYAR